MLSKQGVYTGPVVFVDGAHYPVGADGHPRLRDRFRRSLKLLWDADQETYRYWDGTGSDHLGLYHAREHFLQVGD